MAIRQASPATGKPKKPRIQAIVTEELLAQLEEYAESEGLSVSRAVDEILRRFFREREAGDIAPDSAPKATITKAEPNDDESMEKMRKVIELAKMAGVL